MFVKPVLEREQWLRATLEGLGYELVDLESSRSGLMRVFIDSPRGVTVQDCALVSNHLTRLFAVEGVDYERLEDFARFAGREATVKLKLPVEGRRRFEGRVVGVQDGRVVLESEGKRHHIAFEDIDRARLVPDV